VGHPVFPRGGVGFTFFSSWDGCMTHSDRLVILKGDEIAGLLAGRETEILDVVRRAYLAHHRGESSLPHSNFLRFPGNDTDRIIALPAFLGDGFQAAGVKWIASFPANVQRGMARASAVLILNSCETGRPEAILESSLISAKRTAASAAVAAAALLPGKTVDAVGLIGTGVINLEIARFLRAAVPGLRRFVLFDLDRERAGRFGQRLIQIWPEAEVEIVSNVEMVLRSCPLIAFATTAIRPHISNFSMCQSGTTILHISLRDLSPELILSCDNVVDDIDHVLRAQTSVHLAEQLIDSRNFIRCTLAEILGGDRPARRDEESITVFSPFGLGILDIALGKWTLDLAHSYNVGTHISSFSPSEEFR
jgi:2,3-diaminopropionate biosynthesis protein SbnB